MKKHQIKSKYKWVYIRTRLATYRTVWKYLRYYRKLRRRYFWRLKYRYHKFFLVNNYNKKLFLNFFKKNSHRLRLKSYSNFKKLWLTFYLRMRLLKQQRARKSLFPKWRKFYTRRADFYQYINMRVGRFLRGRIWRKLRKKWLWARQIKRSVKVQFLSSLKRYFAYRIAVRKYFRSLVPSWSSHVHIFNRQLPMFLVQKKLIPALNKATMLVKAKRIAVDGLVRNHLYIVKPFDIITFYFRKLLIWFKQKRFKYKRNTIKLLDGLIYNKRIKSYIFYKAVSRFRGRLKRKYFYYYYFYRNLLQ